MSPKKSGIEGKRTPRQTGSLDVRIETVRSGVEVEETD